MKAAIDFTARSYRIGRDSARTLTASRAPERWFIRVPWAAHISRRTSGSYGTIASRWADMHVGG